jgi:hypothetical protein
VEERYDEVSDTYFPWYVVRDLDIDKSWQVRYSGKPIVSGGHHEGPTMTAPLEPIYAEYRERSGYATKKSGPEFFGFCNPRIISSIEEIDPVSRQRVFDNAYHTNDRQRK